MEPKRFTVARGEGGGGMARRGCVYCGDPIDEEYSEAVEEDLCEDCYMERYNRYDDGERAAERRQMGLVDF
jgi:hypothetical protein